MPPPRAPRVVLLSAPGTLGGIDPLLRKLRIRLIRIDTVVQRPVPVESWWKRLGARAGRDGVIVTSRAGVVAGVRPWVRRTRTATGGIRFWAAGPGTASALRALGARHVSKPPTAGADGIVRALRQSPARNLLYFRSDRAGPSLANELRRGGHRVTEIVAYRVRPVAALTPTQRREIREADVLVATSPSSLSSVRRGLDRRTFDRVRSTARLVVLGERSLRAARGHGFRAVRVAPSTAAQGFTRYLLRELRHAPS
jgi:uroporphyrinogen-III synthase